MNELNRTDILMEQMSEARLNDLVYMLEKFLFFQPTFGGNASPRGCDIRVVMDMVIPSRLEGRGMEACILRPDEVAGASHTTMYQNVSFAHVFDTTLEYIEDHWIKEEIPLAAKQSMWDHCAQPGHVFDTVKTMDESRCGPQSASK
jgi:hypothetical protein